MRLNTQPDFLIVGAMKAGTSSLYDWLTEHPDVLGARTKELHFFDTAGGDPRDYWAQFPLRLTVLWLRLLRRRPVITGEATPFYLFHPLVPERVHRLIPNVKLIVILRDPVERAISHYWHEVRMGREHLSMLEAVQAEDQRIAKDWERLRRGQDPSADFMHYSYVARGRYGDQMDRWSTVFSSEQVLILHFEDLVADPRSVYERALTFLGIRPGLAPLPCFEPKNVGNRDALDPATSDYLHAAFAPSEQARAGDYERPDLR